MQLLGDLRLQRHRHHGLVTNLGRNRRPSDRHRADGGASTNLGIVHGCRPRRRIYDPTVDEPRTSVRPPLDRPAASGLHPQIRRIS